MNNKINDRPSADSRDTRLSTARDARQEAILEAVDRALGADR